MVELLGSEYVADHCYTAFKQRQKEAVYRSYTSDLLKVIAEALGAKVRYRYSELTDYEPKKEKSGDEVALEVIQRAGLKVKK